MTNQMTIGQRIAQKRKELNLSQEGLGEQLGVSRQSIYKWESDATLPEIGKLVALSKLFGVPVGWLLGVEEERPAPGQEPAEDGQLSETQLQMVEEIVSRYLAAQPRPKPRKKWPWMLAAVVLMASALSLQSSLSRLNSDYQGLSYSVNNITHNVNTQINSISNRVEEILKAQNHLAAVYNCEYNKVDLKTNSITFTANVTPKTYTPGMEVRFLVDWGAGSEEFPALQGENHSFSHTFSCPLTDSISVSSIFVTDGVRQTQLLDQFDGLYSGSIPDLNLQGLDWHELAKRGEDGLYTIDEHEAYCRVQNIDGNTKFGYVEIREIQVGLFINGQLHAWLTPCEQPSTYIGFEGQDFYRLDDRALELEEGDKVWAAAIYTDQYGRQGVAPSLPVHEVTDGVLGWTNDSNATRHFDLNSYTF